MTNLKSKLLNTAMILSIFLITSHSLLPMKKSFKRKSSYFPSLRFLAARTIIKSHKQMNRVSEDDLNKIPLELRRFIELLIETHNNLLNALCRTIAFPSLYSCDDTKDLLLAGANPNGIDVNNKVPLMHAVDARSAERAKILLDYGADVDQKNAAKLTPIFYAIAQCNNPEMVIFFLKNGANVQQIKYFENSERKTLLIQAIEKNNHRKVIKKLLKYGANSKQASKNYIPLTVSATQHSSTILALLLKHGADVNQIHPNNGTALHFSARYDSLQTAKLLLKHGALLNCRDIVRETPLMDAARFGSLRVASLLLTYGADKSLTNNQNQTALDLAKDKGYGEMIRLLS